MLTETFSSLQNSSDFSNGTGKPNYFMMCVNETLGPLLWTGFSVICFLLGFPASIVVLQELCQRHRQNSNDFFVFNLTIIDVAFLTVLPFRFSNYMVWHNIEFEWFCNFMYSLTISGRPLFMACVCGDYYFAVVHPIIYMTSKRIAMIRRVIFVIVWVFIVCFGSLAASYAWIFTTTFASIPLFISMPVIGFCDISVFQALRRNDPSGKSYVHPQKKRALRTIIHSFVMTFTVYLPPSVIFTLGHNTQLNFELYYCILNFIGVCFTVSGCVIMPVLYLHSVGQFNIHKLVEKMKLG